MYFYCDSIYEKSEYHGIFIHGLNNNPAIMNSLLSFFSDEYGSCSKLLLDGHWEKSNRLSEFKECHLDRWIDNLDECFENARSKSPEKKIVLFSYSLGAVLALYYLMTRRKVVEKMIFFAPAITLKKSSRIISLIPKWGNISIPSFSPKKIRANNFTPKNAYTELFKMSDFCLLNSQNLKNYRALVFIDPKDEMISYSDLNKLVTSEKLSNWKIEHVEKNSGYHHLIVDRNFLNDREWNTIVDKIKRFI